MSEDITINLASEKINQVKDSVIKELFEKLDLTVVFAYDSLTELFNLCIEEGVNPTGGGVFIRDLGRIIDNIYRKLDKKSQEKYKEQLDILYNDIYYEHFQSPQEQQNGSFANEEA